MNRWRWWAFAAAVLGVGAGVMGYLALELPRPELPNTQCPVMPQREADDGHDVYYKGRRVRLCCDSCVAAFRADPERYVAQLPAHYHDAPSLLGRLRLPSLDEVFRFFEGHRPATSVIVAALVMFLASYRFAGEGSKVRRALRIFGRPVIIPLVAQAVVIVELTARSPRGADLTADDAQSMRTQFTFQYDMFRGLVAEAESGVGPRLSAVYYRGNDERGDSMFNKGDYRTATFHVGLFDEAGNELRHGDSATGRKLSVRVAIIRGPFTADTFFPRVVMAKVGLIGGDVRMFGEPGRFKPVVLTETVRDARWEGAYPIADFSVDAPSRELEGVVYLSPMADSLGSAQYGIQYFLRIKDGKLEPESRLWMAAVFFTDRELPNWFHYESIPELPGPNTTDPVLLGITNPDGSPKAKVK